MAAIIEYLTIWNLLLASAALLLLLLLIGKVPLRYNVRNLTIRWKTTLMTALAFTAVIAILTVMMAFVNGIKKITEQTGQPGNVIVLSDGATDEILSNLTIGDLTEIENLPLVERRDGRPMSSRETFMVANQQLPNAGGRTKRRLLQLRGIEDPQVTADVHQLELLPGGAWFSEAGIQEVPPSTTGKPSNDAPLIQAVVGEGLARELARHRTAEEVARAKTYERLDVGDTFVLRERNWIIVGVLKSNGMMFNSEIWAKRSLLASLFGKETYTTLVLRTKDADTATALKNYLTMAYKKAAVAPQTETEYYANLSETTQQFSFAIGFLAVVMSVGGIFGVMNTMFAAISQRMKDIGVLRLLGYRRRQILISFLLESLAIALVGGLVGCGLGSLSDGWTATGIMTSHSGGGKFVVLQLAVSNRILASGILLSLVMGMLGGLLPALSAMRLKPLQALK